MKAFGVAALVFLFFASQAVALSCMRPNIARTFNHVAASEDVYIMGKGTLQATREIPKYKQGQPRKIPAEFTGAFYGLTGPSEIHTVSLTVDAICYASWCGGFPETNDEMLVFLKQSPTGYRLESNPCDGHFKVAPSNKEVRILQRCLRKEKCSKANLQALQPNF